MQNNQNTSASDKTKSISTYLFGGFSLDLRQRKLSNKDGATINLSARAFDTLSLLLKHHGMTISKVQILQKVWPDVVVEENNLNQAISSLRKNLGDTRNANRFILTVPGRGYCFIAHVEEVLESPSKAALDTHKEIIKSAKPAISLITNKETSSKTSTRIFNYAISAVLVLAAVVGLAAIMQPNSLSGNSTENNSDLASSSTTLPLSANGIISNSLAILPFSNLNPENQNTPFSVGLHDEVINQLSKIRSLNVISRDSILPLTNRELSISEIASLLKVETVMSGTILQGGDKVRINLQLLDPRSGLTLWADTYETPKSDLSEMISIQSDIATHVAKALQTEIHAAEQANISAIPTSSSEAYRLVQAAKYSHYQQDYIRAWDLSQQAIEYDPDYFDAHFTFATVNTIMLSTPLPGMSTKEHFDLGLASAQRMIEIAPERITGYALKTVAQTSIKNWTGVRETLNTMMALNPSPSELKYISLVLLCLGEFDRSIEIYEATLVTEPLDFFARGFLMAAYELTGNMEMAKFTYETGEEMSPVWWGDTVNIFLALGRDEPLTDIDELVGISPELNYLLHSVNDVEVIRNGIFNYANNENKSAVDSLYYAALAAHINEQELAVELLASGMKDVWTSLFWAWLPVFDETRQLASFRDMLQGSGLIDYWQQYGWPETCQPTEASFECSWRAFADN